MSRYYTSSYHNPDPYVPASLSEIYDLLGSMLLWAPTFVSDPDAVFEENIDTEFQALTGGFGKVRKKLGEERYAKLMELAGQAKALFADDPDDDNGKSDQGRELLYEIEELIQATRSRRKAAKLEDDEGEISGD